MKLKHDLLNDGGQPFRFNLRLRVEDQDHEVPLWIPCRFTGRLDRTVTGSLHNGRAIEVELPGGWPIWVPRQSIEVEAHTITEAEALGAAKSGPEYVE